MTRKCHKRNGVFPLENSNYCQHYLSKNFPEKKKKKFWRIKEINSMHACAFYKIRLWQESLFLKKKLFLPEACKCHEWFVVAAVRLEPLWYDNYWILFFHSQGNFLFFIWMHFHFSIFLLLLLFFFLSAKVTNKNSLFRCIWLQFFYIESIFVQILNIFCSMLLLLLFLVINDQRWSIN